MRYRTRPSTPGNRARELQEKREKIARKSPTGLGEAEDWAWRNGDQATRRLLMVAQKAVEAQRRAEKHDVDQARRDFPLYVRFGDLPVSGRSNTARRAAQALGMPHNTDKDAEDGISCYRGWRETPEVPEVPDVLETHASEDSERGEPSTERISGPTFVLVETRMQAAVLAVLLDVRRPAYLLRGAEAGFGGDGEPVLHHAEIAGSLSLEEIKPCGPYAGLVGIEKSLEDIFGIEQD